MKPSLSVCLALHRSEASIRPCIRSILQQINVDFEIVIVEDPPFDRTKRIVDELDDNRITYVQNEQRMGISRSRNLSVQLANGERLFFTDGDCVASRDWLEQGLRSLSDLDCVGVEGRTFYVSEEYKPTLSDGVVENRNGGNYNTCNMAYHRRAIEHLGGFDERYVRNADRDLALRAMKLGRVNFNPAMRVYHRKVSLDGIEYVRRSSRVRNRVILYKRFGMQAFGMPDRRLFLWRILYPEKLMAILVPLLILRSLIRGRCRTRRDFNMLPFIYFGLIYERLSLWHMCAIERVLLI